MDACGDWCNGVPGELVHDIMRENIRIIKNPFPYRDPGMERRVVEYRREALIDGMLLAGAIMIFIAIMW